MLVVNVILSGIVTISNVLNSLTAFVFQLVQQQSSTGSNTYSENKPLPQYSNLSSIPLLLQSSKQISANVYSQEHSSVFEKSKLQSSL